MRYPILLALLLPLLVTLCTTAWSDPFQQEQPPQGNMSYAVPQHSLLMDNQQHHFLPVDIAFQPHVWRSGNRAWVDINIHPGYYLYRQRIGLKAHGHQLTLGTLELPQGIAKQDRFMGDVEIYRQRLLFSVPIIHDQGNQALGVELTYQGCADAGLCYPPEHHILALPESTLSHQMALPLQEAAADNTADDTQKPQPESAATSATLLASGPMPVNSQTSASGVSFWQLGVLFLAGTGLVFTPCVLPMLPIVAALVVGQSSTLRRSLWLSFCYVAGMVVTYTLVGMIIGLVGAGLNLQARLQSPWVVIPFALLFVLLALFTLEWLHLPNLGVGQRASRLEERFRQLGPIGLVIAGGLSTLIISPCLSAPLAGVLTYISTTGNAVAGGLSLFMLALGMGIPLILVCVFGSGILPQRGAWMERVRHLSAVVLLGVALWLVSSWLPGWLTLLLEGWLTLMTGLMLGAFQSLAPVALRAIGLILVVWGSCCVVGTASGEGTPLKPLTSMLSHTGTSTSTSTLQADTQTTASSGTHLPKASSAHALHFTTITTLAELHQLQQQARQQHLSLILDLYADWCVSCKRMEADLFPQPAIARQLSHFVRVRFNMTQNNADARSLLTRYHLFGPPSVLFFDHGNEIPSLRLQGEPTSQQLLSVLTRAINTEKIGS